LQHTTQETFYGKAPMKCMDRNEIIKPWITKKRVLDIGSAAHGDDRDAGFLFDLVVSNASEVIGIDNDAEAIRKYHLKSGSKKK
jgi:hypothetical protein